MEEYKFRVWDYKEKRYYFYDNIFDVERPYTETSTFPQYESYPEYHEVSVEQYIGRKDINDKNVYKNDIVKITDCKTGTEYIGVVKFGDCSFYIDTGYSSHYRWVDYEIEVLGNIREDKELIEKYNIGELI